jgi:hypothetical protein
LWAVKCDRESYFAQKKLFAERIWFLFSLTAEAKEGINQRADVNYMMSTSASVFCFAKNEYIGRKNGLRGLQD